MSREVSSVALRAMDVIDGWLEAEIKASQTAQSQRLKHRHRLICLLGYHRQMDKEIRLSLGRQGTFYLAKDGLRKGNCALAIRVLEQDIEACRLREIDSAEGDADLGLLPHQGEARKAAHRREYLQEIVDGLKKETV